MEDKNLIENKSGFGKKEWIRLAIVIALIAIAVSAFGYGVSQFFTAENGYREIEFSGNVANCSSDFIFTYNLGVSGKSPTAELKAVTNLYSEKATFYYRVFNSTETFDGINNVASINGSPNRELEVPSELYEALKKASSDGRRDIFLGPVYEYYECLFNSDYDEDAATWDPQKNGDLKNDIDRALAYINSDEHVRLEFNGGRKVVLFVSKEYLDFAEETGVNTYIDFYWMKNAVIVDLMAHDMETAGFTHGAISSKDGFVRNFDSSDPEYAFDFLFEQSGYLYSAGQLKYNGKASIVSLHTFLIDSMEEQYYYKYEDGTQILRYISCEDALPHGYGSDVVAYAKDRDCFDILLSISPYYLSDSIADFSSDTVGTIINKEGRLTVRSVEGFSFSQD